MERTAYFPGIRIEESRRFCGFDLFMDQGCLAVRAEDAEEKDFFRKINLLKAGLVMYAYEKKEDGLMAACRLPVVYESPCAGPVPCLFEDWESIRWIFDHENQTSVFWFASFLTGSDMRSRYLSLYYALKAIAGKQGDLSSILESCAGHEAAGGFLNAVERLRMDREDLEERGIELPELNCDGNLLESMAEVWNQLYAARTK